MSFRLPQMRYSRDRDDDDDSSSEEDASAAGHSDIDDPASELHCRYDVGVKSFGRYHSVDTGKLTLAPRLSVQAANAVGSRARIYCSTKR